MSVPTLCQPVAVSEAAVIDARLAGGAFVVSTSTFDGLRVVTLESPDVYDQPLLPHEALALACALLSHLSVAIPKPEPRIVATFACPCGVRWDLAEDEDRAAFDRDVLEHVCNGARA